MAGAVLKRGMRPITYHRHGPPEVLELSEVAKPEPGEGEELIRVKAVEVTKADYEMCSFRYAVQWFWLTLRLTPSAALSMEWSNVVTSSDSGCRRR